MASITAERTFGSAIQRAALLLPVALLALPGPGRSQSSARVPAAEEPIALAESQRLAGNDREAVRLYERILSARWSRLEEAEPGEALPLLESLAAILSLAHFPDGELAEAIRSFDRTFDSSRPAEAFYIAGSRLLSRKLLSAEAERILLAAARAFPGSRPVRIELAELYAKTEKLEPALEVLEDAKDMDGPEGRDPVADRHERALIDVRIGQLDVRLGRLDDAIEAYRSALEIAPDALEARLELAGQYLGRDMLEEALAEYASVLTARPATADAHYGLAELHLRAGGFQEAAAAAGRALQIDPEHQRARYARARALIQAGATEEAEEVLEAYRQREAITQARVNAQVKLSALRGSAVAALMEGRTEAAMALFREGIEEQPRAAELFFDLGIAQSKLGRHRDAAATFQIMLDLGCCPDGDSFLVHRNLSLAYDALGDAEASRRHRALYLREYDAVLEAALGPAPSQ